MSEAFVRLNEAGLVYRDTRLVNWSRVTGERERSVCVCVGMRLLREPRARSRRDLRAGPAFCLSIGTVRCFWCAPACFHPWSARTHLLLLLVRASRQVLYAQDRHQRH